MDTGHCPKCGATTVVAGWMAGHRWGRHLFEPTGMRFFKFRLWGEGVRCEEPLRACLTCGLVWTHLPPERLRTFIDENGTAEAKLKLSPPRPEQEVK